MAKAFGIPIESAVHRQLEARKEVLKQDSRVLQRNMLLQNKGAWIRVVSGVDTKNPNEEEYTDTLASNFILQGGVLKSKQAADGKRNTQLREGIQLLGNFLDDEKIVHNGAYAYDQQLGYRPMPGIDSFTVQSQGSYGTLKKADIGFKVWSLEQLDAMEQLYFRPGFNILVEYGSSSYLDSSNDNLDVTTLDTSLAQDFLTRSKTLAELDRKIDELEEKTSYNYTGFIGRIINFSWAYNTDGGFDCSVQMQARGEIVESLKLLLKDDKESGLDEFVKSTTTKAPEFTILKGLKALKINGKNKEFAKKYLLDENGKFDDKEFIVTRSNRFNVEGLEQEASEDSKYEPGTSYENQFVFTTLGTIFTLCNNFVIPENEKKEKETKFRTKRYERKHSSPYITFPGHIALNPTISMLPKKDGAGAYLSDLDLYGNYTDSVKYPNEVIDSRLESDNIYHILVNIDQAISIVESFFKDSDNTDGINVFTFIKTLLGKLNSNQGGINQLDLDLDKKANEWRVVDRNYYDPEKSSGEKYSELDIVGLGSLVTNFSLETKISGELTNMLAISAAVSGNKEDLNSMSRYNKGVKDRYKDSVYIGVADKKVETESDEDSDTEKVFDDGGKISNAYVIYNKRKKLDEAAFNNTKLNHSSFTSKAYKQYQQSLRMSGKKAAYKGIIPMGLSLTIDGISGLKVGEAFRINNNVLPSRYTNRVGFIITGLTDNINSNNRWETQINTKMFNLPSNEQPSNADEWKKQQAKLQKVKAKRRKQAIKELSEYSAVNSAGQENVKAMYGKPGAGPFSTVVVPKGFNLTYDGKPVTKIRNVHSKVSGNLTSAFNEILSSYGEAKVKQLKINLYSGTYNKRTKRGGTTWSMHSWGIAIDLYYAKNKLRTKAPEAAFSKPEYKEMIDIFERNGFYSLGRAKNYDYMHFQAWDPNQKE